MASILLVRHGQASFGAVNYDQLSELGRAQSKRLGEFLLSNGEQIDALYSGPMLRHQQTAQGVIDGLQSALTPVLLPEWAEFDHKEVIVRFDPTYADHTAFVERMRSGSDAKAAFATMFGSAMARWVGGEFDHEYKESWTSFQQRSRGALRSLAHASSAQHTQMVVTSGGVISVIVQGLMGLTDAMTLDTNWRLANGSITRINVDAKGRCTLHSLNEQSHFRGNYQHQLTWR